MMPERKWINTEPGVLVLGSMVIRYRPADRRFVLSEDEKELGDYEYLIQAKMVGGARQSEIEEMGL